MTWEQALRGHTEQGHHSFVHAALSMYKSEIFIRNVCNHLGCKE